jgi:transposase
MEDKKLFEIALNIQEPWYIKEIKFERGTEEKRGRIDIEIDFKVGSKFKDRSGKKCSVYDTHERIWKHLNFFENSSYIYCRVPRITTSEGKVETIETPWSRSGSGFTLLFEGFGMQLIENEMSINKASSIMGIVSHRLWRVFNHWVERAKTKQEIREVSRIGIDETSSKKGHKYVTVVMDMKLKKVIYVTSGKDAETLSKFNNYIESKGIKSDQIKEVCMDMSPSYISGVTEIFGEAKIIFDKFHVMKIVNEAMDHVRKQERREHEELKGQRYIFLKANKNLSARQQQLIELLPTIGEAYRLKELIKDFWELEDPSEAEGFLTFWCDLATESKIPAYQRLVNTIKSHWFGILNYTTYKINNGILEGINSKIQLAKRRARGFRNINNFMNMIYFIAGKLDLDYPHYTS